MFAKRKLILTATTCSTLENLRTAIEVLKGMRTSFVHMQLERDLRSGKGRLFLSSRDGDGGEREVAFILDRPGEFRFELYGEWFFARVLNFDRIQVISERIPPGDALMWKVGHSFCARWEERL